MPLNTGSIVEKAKKKYIALSMYVEHNYETIIKKICICICVYIYIYTYIYIYIYMYIYICIYMGFDENLNKKI